MAHPADLTLPECHIHSLDSAACCPHHTQSLSCRVTETPWTLHLKDTVQIPALSFSSVIIYRLKGALTGKLNKLSREAPASMASPGPDLPLSSKTCSFLSRSLATVKGLGLTEQDPLQRGARVHTTGTIMNILEGHSRD